MLLDPEMGLKWTCRRLGITQVAIFVYRRVAVAHTSVPIRTWVCTNVFRTSDSKYHGRSMMSVVAFRTAPPIGGLSCFSVCQLVVLGVI